ncbi:MAG TPA: uroporphyrinogen decarboxylase, partial [Planctomycetaceae bacterium]|nr:uroporphyrinogen decarboxylase [Planctomycetaceae bacterium]
LLPILEPMGLDLEYLKGEGPVIHNPIQDSSQVDRLTDIADMDCLDFVFQAVKLIRADLPADIPLLGFAGCPFTLASYAIEGGSSKNYRRTKQMMYNDPGAWDALMNRFVDNLVVYLQRQIAAGCQAVQIFDSWAGCLSPEDYQQYVQPYTAKLVAGVQDQAPVINFLTGNPALLGLQRQAGGQVFGVDWRINLADAWEIFGPDVAIQGNMDPIALYADLPVLRQKAKAVLDAAAGRKGHIFNLGHGVMPDMNPDHVKALVEMVHEMGTR